MIMIYWRWNKQKHNTAKFYTYIGEIKGYVYPNLVLQNSCTSYFFFDQSCEWSFFIIFRGFVWMATMGSTEPVIFSRGVLELFILLRNQEGSQWYFIIFDKNTRFLNHLKSYRNPCIASCKVEMKN